MLQACYPAEIGNNSFMWADRGKSTTQLEFDLAQRQAEAVSKLYARLNTHVSATATSDTTGAGIARSAALHEQRRLSKTNYTVLSSVGCRRGKLSNLVGSCYRKSRVQRSFCCQFRKPRYVTCREAAVTNVFSAVTAESKQRVTVHRGNMARHNQTEHFGISEQLSSRNCHTGYRQAVNSYRNFLCQEGLLFTVLASLTFLFVRSCAQSTTAGLTDPSYGFKLPGPSTRLGQCAAT